MLRYTIRIVILLMLILSASHLVGRKFQAPGFVPGEILAKFTAGTDGDTAVRSVQGTTRADLEALREVVGTLSEKVEIPLKVKSVQGGQWFLMSIDSAEVTNRLIKKLCKMEQVAQAKRSCEPPQTHVGYTSPRRIVARFLEGGPEATAAKSGDDSRFLPVIKRLEEDTGLPLEAKVTPEAVLLRFDLSRLTLQLVEKLKALPDVEAAQPNYIARIG